MRIFLSQKMGQVTFTTLGFRNTLSADYISTSQGGSGFGYTIGVSSAPVTLVPVNVSISVPGKE